MLNYSKRLSMRREIQNRLIFQPNPESFCRAIIFSNNNNTNYKGRYSQKNGITFLLLLYLRSSLRDLLSECNKAINEQDKEKLCRILGLYIRQSFNINN
jgi:hypothetical protein